MEARYTGSGVGRDWRRRRQGLVPGGGRSGQPAQAESGCGGGRARRPVEPGPGDQWKQGRTSSGRLRVLDSEKVKGLDGAAAGFGWGRPRNFGAPRARGRRIVRR